MSISTGGFSGSNALLAFAATQQGRMNEELSESMRNADIKSQMIKDIADIKAHFEGANHKTDEFGALDAELQAFMEKYKDEPACAEGVATVKEIADSISLHMREHEKAVADNEHGFGAAHATWVQQGSVGPEPIKPPAPTIPAYEEWNINFMLGQLQSAIDDAGANDQLAMIHMKQLNDNINNSSGMVSGIIESRQNALSQIINNFA